MVDGANHKPQSNDDDVSRRAKSNQFLLVVVFIVQVRFLTLAFMKRREAKHEPGAFASCRDGFGFVAWGDRASHRRVANLKRSPVLSVNEGPRDV
jgi:hypothetical protein